MLKAMAIASLIFSINAQIDLLTANDFAAETPASFSYCSNGTCQLAEVPAFNKIRKMPLDLHHTCVKDHHYALTFDDGPSANLESILNLLHQYGVRATFFVVGHNLSHKPFQTLLQRAATEGHQIANHTYSHADLTKLSEAQILEQVEKTRLSLEAILSRSDKNRDAYIVRPPFGNIDQRIQNVLKAHGYISVRWNADRYDWQLKAGDGAKVLARVQQQFDYLDHLAKQRGEINFSILDLNHEGASATLEVLETMLIAIKARGYEFVTLQECLQLGN